MQALAVIRKLFNDLTSHGYWPVCSRHPATGIYGG
jgi:hypothetical protein